MLAGLRFDHFPSTACREGSASVNLQRYALSFVAIWKLFGVFSVIDTWIPSGYLNDPSLVIGCHWFGLLMKRLRILGLMHRDIKPENFRFKDRAATTLQVGWLLNAYNTWSKVVLHV